MMWLYVFGGPATQVLSLFACILYLPENFKPTNYFPGLFENFPPLSAFFLANAWILALSLFPRKAKGIGLGVYTDGYQLLRIPFANSKEFAKLIDFIPRLEASELLANGENEKAIEKYNELLASDPTDILLKHDLAVARLQLGEFEAAREVFCEALRTSDSTNINLTLVFKNNIAWINAVLNRPELLEEASRFSYEVNRSRPNWEHAIGTRGTVLVRQGDLDKGIEYLVRAHRLHSSPQSRSSCATFIAIAKAKNKEISLHRKSGLKLPVANMHKIH